MSIARELVNSSDSLIDLLLKIEAYNKSQFKKTNKDLNTGKETYYSSRDDQGKYSGPMLSDYIKFSDGSSLFFGSPLGIRIEEPYNG